ncbi:MAG: TolC family protein [Magnetococcales bacterium]|nr:TolC family protein [Magnetococcales bacterium]
MIQYQHCESWSLRAKKNFPILFFVLVVWHGASNTHAAPTKSMNSDAQIFWVAVDNALARSPTIQRQAAALRAAQESDPQSLSRLLPLVNITASKTLDEKTSYRRSRVTSSNEPSQIALSIAQPIFNYVNLLGRDQSTPQIDAAVADLNFAQQDLVVRVATLTSNWLEAKEVYVLSDNYIKITTKAAHVVGLRFKAGESTETELHEAESKASQAEASAINARNVMDKAAANFAEVVGEFPAPDLVLPTFRWQEPPQFESRLSEFIEGRADVRAARARMQESDVTIRMRRAEHVPTLRFTYTSTYTWDSERLGGLSGRSFKEDMENQNSVLSLDVPIFSGGAITSRTRQAQAEWEGRVSEVDRLRLLATRESQEARLDMANLQMVIKAQERALRSNQKALAGLQEGFLAGTRTLLELLNTQNEALTVQTNLVRSRYQHRLASIRLWAAVGWPLTPEHTLAIVAESGAVMRPKTTGKMGDMPMPTEIAVQPAVIQPDMPTQSTAKISIIGTPITQTESSAVPVSSSSSPPTVSAKTNSLLPESGRRPMVILDTASNPADSTDMPALAITTARELPRIGWGPYYVCVGIYPDKVAMRPMERTLASRGVPSVLEMARTLDDRLVIRVLVGPFADFTDLIQARKLIDGWTNRSVGWVRNRKWAPALQGGGELLDSDTSAIGFVVSGPFYAEMPDAISSGQTSKRNPSPTAYGPLNRHMPDGTSYVHSGAFQTEKEMDMAKQQLVKLQVSGTAEVTSQRDMLRSPDGNEIHRLLIGPFESHAAGMEARRAIQQKMGILTGIESDPRWEDYQSCPDESLLLAATPDGSEDSAAVFRPILCCFNWTWSFDTLALALRR